MEETEQLVDFGSLGGFFAWEFAEHGAKALKDGLAVFVADKRCYRELLWQPAAELMALGLRKPAVMVRNASLKCESITNIDQFWPYTAEPNPTNIKAAQASAERQVSKARKQAAELLAKAGLTVDWLDGI